MRVLILFLQLPLALDRLLIKHPVLATRIVIDASKKAYQVTPKHITPLPFRIMVNATENDWQTESIAELLKPFNTQKDSFIRFIWLQHASAIQPLEQAISDIMVVCSHTFVDGLSVFNMMRDLLAILGDIEADTVPAIVPTSLDVSESIPDFLGKQRFITKTRLLAMIARVVLTPISYFYHLNTTRWLLDKANYHILQWRLTAEQTTQVSKACKAHSTSVQAALCTAFIRSFAQVKQQSGWHVLQSPTNLRLKLVPPVGETIGLYNGLMELKINSDLGQSFWQVAQQVKQQMINKLTDEHVYRPLVYQNEMIDKLMPILSPDFLATFLVKHKNDLTLSNLGRVDFATQYGKLKFLGLLGPCSHNKPKVMLTAVYTVQHQMTFCATYSTRHLSTLQVEQIKEKAMQLLMDATLVGC